jgi:AcrR family transcriptional regulator
MEAMLIAGEELFREGGSTAVTLEAIIGRAGVSTGSFYSRFGDMDGFLDSMHEHVLQILAGGFEAVFLKGANGENLEGCLQTLLAEAIKLVHENRDVAYFFAIQNSSNSKWQSQGLKLESNLHEAVVQLIKPHLPGSATQGGKMRVDFAVRILNALIFDQILKKTGSEQSNNMSEKKYISEVVAMIGGYLRATSSK